MISNICFRRKAIMVLASPYDLLSIHSCYGSQKSNPLASRNTSISFPKNIPLTSINVGTTIINRTPCLVSSGQFINYQAHSHENIVTFILSSHFRQYYKDWYWYLEFFDILLAFNSRRTTHFPHERRYHSEIVDVRISISMHPSSYVSIKTTNKLYH